MNRSTLSLSDRVAKSAEILKTDSEKVKQALECLGIDVGDEFSEKLIDAETTTEDMIREKLFDFLGRSSDPKTAPKPARVAAAVAILKGRDPFSKPEEKALEQSNNPVLINSSSTDLTGLDKLTVALLQSRPVSQLKDRELLEKYVQERDLEQERELDHRARSQPFIILKDGEKKEPGKEPIDIDASLDLLKRARKGKVNNTIVPYGDKVANVYRVTELNMDDRKVELCPICGEPLYKGYCEKCEMNFQTIGKDERAYMRLIVEQSGRFQKNSFADRKALHASAVKGIDDLRSTWPSMSKLFDDLSATNDLPRLILIENRPSRRIADPFNVAGNRSY